MDRSVNGTPDAEFDERLVALYPQLFRLALRLCRNPDDAHDLAQVLKAHGLLPRLFLGHVIDAEELIVAEQDFIHA